MKIAYVIINANRREGTSRAVLEVAERLASRHEVDLIARTVDDADLQQLQWRKVAGPGWPEVGDFQSYLFSADRLLAKSDYDIVHSAGPNCTSADVYTIQTVHPVKCRVMDELGAHKRASLPRRFTRALYDRAVVAAEQRAYRAAGPRGQLAFLPVSQGTRAELLAEYPVRDALVEVLPNGADLEKFNPQLRDRHRTKIRQQCGFGIDDFILVFSGGDWVRKGLRIAAEALALTADPKIKLLVVGDDPLADDFRQSLQPLGLGSRIYFAGFQSQVERYYAASDAFVFPTAYEAFSLATIEAAASGLPVLMPEVSGAKELVGSGEAGELVERTPQAFAVAIERLANDPQHCRQLGEGARRLVEREFAWDVVAEATEHIYKRLLANRRERPTREVAPA